MDGMAAMFAALMASRGGITPGQYDSKQNRPRTAADKAAERQRLIEHHNGVLERSLASFRDPKMAHLLTTSSTNTKPASDFPVPPPVDSCTPIAIADLLPGVTHRGRVLRGKLLVKPMLMTGLATLLEDEYGDVVRVALYNFLPSNVQGIVGLRAGERALPVGQAVAVLEPFYKIMSDGLPGVRVDNPKELVLLDSLAPANAAALRADGGRHFQAAEYEAAADCYSRALQRMPEADGAGTVLLMSVLLNLSATHHKLGQGARALQCAAAAVTMQPEAHKAHYRTALALASVGAPLAARCAMHKAFQCMPAGGPSEEERRRMLEELGQQQPGVYAPLTPQQVTEGQTEMLRVLSSRAALDGAATGPEAHTAASASSSGHDMAAALAAATASKDSGNVAFRAGDFATALSAYLAVANELRVLPAAVLLSNLAACHLQRSRPKQALTAATAAAILDPTNAKAHYRRAQALMQLGWMAEANAVCEAGMAAVGKGEGRDMLRELKERIRTGKKTAGKGHDDSIRDRYITERDLEASRAPKATVENTHVLNMLTGMASRLGPGFAPGMARLQQEDPLMWMALQPDERVPPFHEEFSKAGRWPALCDVEQCGKKIWEGFELCRGMPMHLMHMAFAGSVEPVDIIKRIGAMDEAIVRQRLQWLTAAPEGSVSFRDYCMPGYNPTIFQSFSNAHAATVPMPPPSGGSETRPDDTTAPSSSGSSVPRTHVAVGFVDLGTLAAAVDMPEWDEQVRSAMQEVVTAAKSGGAAGTVPLSPRPHLRWVGYEAAPYSVAKTLVLARVMRAGGPSAAEHAFQVWYSSVWSQDTLAAFRKALTDLLREHQAGGAELPAEVLPYLRHWQLRDVGLAESRRRWLEDRKRPMADIGEYKEKSDRLALCEYLLTGQLQQQGGGELVGSVVMFGKPKGGPERALDECFLQALHPHEVLAARTGSAPSGGASSSHPDVVSAAAALLRRRVRRLTVLMATGRVEVQVHLRTVEPGDEATAARISSLRPATMSWSNVPDYYPPRDFHRMARKCSVPGTVHHMHSMNWVMDVKGACHLDALMPYMDGQPGRREGLERSRLPKIPKEARELVLAMLEEGKRAVRDIMPQYGRALLYDPPMDNPRNIVDFGLTMAHYKAWAEAFFAVGGLRRSPGSQATITAPPVFGPHTRTNSTFSLAFVYDS